MWSLWCLVYGTLMSLFLDMVCKSFHFGWCWIISDADVNFIAALWGIYFALLVLLYNMHSVCQTRADKKVD